MNIVKQDIWQYLKTDKKPIVLYGMGNGADKIIAVLEERGMRAADFFASDGFVRGQLFHGKRVLLLSEVKEKYTDFIILAAFGSHLPEVCGAIRRLDEQYELYAPDVPVAGEELFDADYYEANKVRFECARALLADEHSRFVFDCVIKYKLSGKISCLAACESEQENDMRAIFPERRHAEKYAFTLQRNKKSRGFRAVGKGLRQACRICADAGHGNAGLQSCRMG